MAKKRNCTGAQLPPHQLHSTRGGGTHRWVGAVEGRRSPRGDCGRTVWMPAAARGGSLRQSPRVVPRKSKIGWQLENIKTFWQALPSLTQSIPIVICGPALPPATRHKAVWQRGAGRPTPARDYKGSQVIGSGCLWPGGGTRSGNFWMGSHWWLLVWKWSRVFTKYKKGGANQ